MGDDQASPEMQAVWEHSGPFASETSDLTKERIRHWTQFTPQTTAGVVLGSGQHSMGDSPGAEHTYFPHSPMGWRPIPTWKKRGGLSTLSAQVTMARVRSASVQVQG